MSCFYYWNAGGCSKGWFSIRGADDTKETGFGMSISCSTYLCSGVEGEMILLACEQGIVASCAACVRLESSWELRALPAEGVDEQTHVAASLQSRKNHGAPKSQGLVLTLPTAACCAFLQRHPLPLICPLLCWSRAVSRGWQMFLGTGIPFIPPLWKTDSCPSPVYHCKLYFASITAQFCVHVIGSMFLRKNAYL